MIQSEEMDWLNGYLKKNYIYVVYKRPTSDLETQREGMEKDISCKGKSKVSWSSKTHIFMSSVSLKETWKDTTY